MKKVTAVLSMLHEPVGAPHSATRRFRNEPVLAWTLKRLWRTTRLHAASVLCWDDQLAAVEPVAGAHKTYVSVRSPRLPMAQIEAVAAARRWGDGWRGGLLGSCEFDRGFYGPWVDDIRLRTEADAILLVDPAAGLIDPVLLDALLAHGEAHPDVELCFSQAAPGLSGVVLSAPLLARLAASKVHPGALLNYQPDSARRDPIGTEWCAPVPAPLARTTHRFTLDSQRQIEKIAAATHGLNGQLMGTEAEGLLAVFDAAGRSDWLPREVVVELNIQRATAPIYWPGARLGIERLPMSLDMARRIFAQLQELDDVRIIFGGIGDPLLHDELPAILDAAHRARIHAIAVETDLVGVPLDRITALAQSPADLVSAFIPALSMATYRQVMGVDLLAQALGNIKLFVEKRHAYGRGVPLLVPTFIKCRENSAEMEAWYDQWLRTLNCAVIAGPSDFAGLIPDVSVADMTPPKRRPCARLSTRLTIRCDGSIVSCEEDVLGKQPLGHIDNSDLRQAWSNCNTLRAKHLAGQWASQPACATCREWHRP